MFCKNLTVYDVLNDSLFGFLNNETIKNIAFVPCSPTDSVKSGFISPLDNDELMIETCDQILLKYQIERKILPSDVVNRAVNEKVSKQEILLNRKLKKSEKLSLKDEVLIDLLPKAFSKFEQFHVWLNKQDKTLAITSSSFKKCEDILAHLRREIGSLGVAPLCSEIAPQKILTQWLRGDKPSCFEIGDCAVLYDCIESNAKVKLINEQIQDSHEVKSYLDGGKEVESLSLIFNKGIRFTVNTNYNISKIKFDNSVVNENEDFCCIDNEQQRVIEDFLVASDVLAGLIHEIKAEFKG